MSIHYLFYTTIPYNIRIYDNSSGDKIIYHVFRICILIFSAWKHFLKIKLFICLFKVSHKAATIAGSIYIIFFTYMYYFSAALSAYHIISYIYRRTKHIILNFADTERKH